MPWQETCVRNERTRFVVDWERKLESMAELCRCYGVSRRTGYKWLQRYQQQGDRGDRGDRGRSGGRSGRSGTAPELPLRPSRPAIWAAGRAASTAVVVLPDAPVRPRNGHLQTDFPLESPS